MRIIFVTSAQTPGLGEIVTRFVKAGLKPVEPGSELASALTNATSKNQWAQVETLLSQQLGEGCYVHALPPQEMEHLHASQAAIPGAGFIVFSQPPEQQITDQRQIEPWLVSASTLVDFAMQNFASTLVVDLTSAIAEPNRLQELCASKFELALKPPELTQPPGSALSELLMLAAIAEDDQIQDAWEALYVTFSLSGPACTADFNQRLAILAASGGHQISESAKHEKELNQQLQQLAAKAEGLEQEKTRLESQNGKLASQLTEQATLLSTSEARTAEVESDNSQLNDTNKKQQAELIDGGAERQKLTERVGQLEAAETGLQKTLSETEKQAEEQQAENELALLQIHQLQEELETIYLEKTTLEKEAGQHKEQITKLETTNTRLQKTLAETEKQAEEQQAENELALLQIHQLQEELESYYLKYVEQTENMTGMSAHLVENQNLSLGLLSYARTQGLDS